MGYPITGAPPSTSLKPSDIATLAELNAFVADATLIDTTDSRLSDTRTPSAHNHAPTEIDGSTETGRALFTASDVVAAQQAIDLEPGVDVSASGHTHSDLGSLIQANTDAQAAHVETYYHRTTDTMAIPCSPVGTEIEDAAVIPFPWPVSGYVTKLEAFAVTAPTTDAAEFEVGYGATWDATPTEVATVAISATAYSGTQETITAPQVTANGLGTITIAADTGGTCADACVVITISPSPISPPVAEGEVKTVAWNFPVVEESSIERFEILRDGVKVLEITDVTARSASLYLYYDSEYTVRACDADDCSSASLVIAVFEPGLADQGTITASSEYEAYPATAAADGRSSTYWRSGEPYADAEWLQVAWETDKSITGYRVFFGIELGQDFTFQVSDNGSDWTTVDTVTDNADQVIVVDGLTTSGKYARLNFTDMVDGRGYGYMVYEFEVIGS